MTNDDQTTPKAQGRPSKGEAAIRHRAMHDAIAQAIERRDAGDTPTATLLDALEWAVGRMDDPSESDQAGLGRATGRAAARGILAELSRRYGLD